MSLSGREFFFHHPNEYIDYVSAVSSRRFSEQHKFSLPEGACDKYDTLVYFVDTLINSDNTSLAGSIVGKIPSGLDGIRLNERVRELLEYVNDARFDHAVISGIINSLEGRFVTDGADRKELSSKYENDASEVELLYPHAAYILRELSQFYLSEGRHDYIESEIYDY